MTQHEALVHPRSDGPDQGPEEPRHLPLGALQDFESCVGDQSVECPLWEHCPKVYHRHIPLHLVSDHNLGLTLFVSAQLVLLLFISTHLTLLFISSHLIQDDEVVIVSTHLVLQQQVVCSIITHRHHHVAGWREAN